MVHLCISLDQQIQLLVQINQFTHILMMSCLFFSKNTAIADKFQSLGLELLVRKSDGKILHEANIVAKVLQFNDIVQLDFSTISVVYADLTDIDPRDTDSINLIRFGFSFVHV